jgi:hypothetical protein
MTTELARIDPEDVTVPDVADVKAALAHYLVTGDVSRMPGEHRLALYYEICRSIHINPLQAGLDGTPQEIDDLSVQAPGLALRAFLQGCVKIGWQADEGANHVGHAAAPLLLGWYNSSTMVAECNSMDDVVIGEIRRAREVGFKGIYNVIAVACIACGAARWARHPGKRGYTPLRCLPCAGRRTIAQNTLSKPGVPRPDISERQRGSKNPNWRGGRKVVGVRAGKRGAYMSVFIGLDHPLSSMATKAGYVMEHRLVLAVALGRPLAGWEQVHHRNGIKDDNRLENLELWKLSQPAGIRQADYHCPGCRCEEPDGHV